MKRKYPFSFNIHFTHINLNVCFNEIKTGRAFGESIKSFLQLNNSHCVGADLSIYISSYKQMPPRVRKLQKTLQSQGIPIQSPFYGYWGRIDGVYAEQNTISGTFFYQNNKTKDLHVFVDPNNKDKFRDPAAAQDIRALVRRVIWRRVVECGGIVLHGGAVKTKEGKVIIIAGDKNVGKTTAVLHLLLKQGCSFISADRVMLWNESEQIKALGWPSTFRIDENTLAECSDNSSAFNRCRFYERNGKLTFRTFEFLNAFKISATGVGPLSTVFLINKYKRNKFKINKIHPAKAVKLVSQYIIKPSTKDLFRGYLSGEDITEKNISPVFNDINKINVYSINNVGSMESYFSTICYAIDRDYRAERM